MNLPALPDLRAAENPAHVPGSVVEIFAPLAVLFSTFPLAVPLEWNVLFAYATIFCSSASRPGTATPCGTCPPSG